MSVLLPNTRLAVQRHTDGERDAHGAVVTGAYDAVSADREGYAAQRADGTYLLKVDPACWPLRPHDLVVEVGGSGRTWTVLTADLLKHSVDSSVDYVRIEGAERLDGGTMTTDSPPRRRTPGGRLTP